MSTCIFMHKNVVTLINKAITQTLVLPAIRCDKICNTVLCKPDIIMISVINNTIKVLFAQQNGIWKIGLNNMLLSNFPTENTYSIKGSCFGKLTQQHCIF